MKLSVVFNGKTSFSPVKYRRFLFAETLYVKKLIYVLNFNVERKVINWDGLTNALYSAMNSELSFEKQIPWSDALQHEFIYWSVLLPLKWDMIRSFNHHYIYN
jgi:hypothetical protein